MAMRCSGRSRRRRSTRCGTAVTVPALVLRAAREVLPGFGFILPAAEAERFVAAVPSAVMAEVDANHYTITTHDDSIAAIGAFLRTS